MRRRSLCAHLMVAAVAAAVGVGANSDASIQLVDRHGLEYVSTEAFCAMHCKPWRRDRQLSECSEQHCHQHLHTNHRQLASFNFGFADANSSKLNVLTCGAEDSSSYQHFQIDARAENDASEQQRIFRGFYESFFSAFDAMISSANASVEACQLQWLQDALLPTSNGPDTNTNNSRPMLVKFDPASDQRACYSSVRSLWTLEQGEIMPLLTRAGQAHASATVLLVHVDSSVALQLADLACVATVQELPAILKLLPFARSAFQLSNRQQPTAPAMWIRLIEGVDPVSVLPRLQTHLTTLYGVTNVFELPSRPDLYPHGVLIKAAPQLDLWAHAVAVALADADVEWIDVQHVTTSQTLRKPAYPMVSRRLDEYIDSLVGVEKAQQLGINGDDVVVGITDSGLYHYHDQFDQDQRVVYNQPDTSARKVVLYYAMADEYDQSADIVCGHGTHVAGLLAGSSYSGEASNIGIAPRAKIAFMDIGTQSSFCAGEAGCEVVLQTPTDVNQLLQAQIDVGAKIFSFSWGTGGSDYSQQARDLDALIYANPEILIVVAAGNSGENSVSGSGTISSPSGAKNVISVGASLNAAASFSPPCPDAYNPMSVASFSSAGPTTDGRLKPDIVAPGMTLMSSRSEPPLSTTKSKETCPLQGTSQATPVVTGMAVLLYQWLREGWWKAGVKDLNYAMEKVPAALLKALLIHSGGSLQRRLPRIQSSFTTCTTLANTATPLGYPDIYQGYGKPNMSNVADFSSTAQSAPTLYFLPNSTAGSEPSVANGKEVRISFTVPRGVDLRATIVWTDPAGSVRATTQLQHDLDLTVQIRNTTTVFYPLTADAVSNRDEKNNVEMVVVTYQQLLDAVNQVGGDGSTLVGPDGEIVVDAIVFGRSVLSADSQAFAFVASSSVIGSTSGIADQTGGGGNGGIGGQPTNTLTGDNSFWTPWTIGGVGAGALVLLALLAGCVRCCTSTKHRRAPGAAAGYQPHATPANNSARWPARVETCPYCAYASNDPVVMVNHVENMHSGVTAAANFALPMVTATTYPGYPPQEAYPGSGYPPLPPPPPHGVGHHITDVRPDERCPFCAFSSTDAVILVNHVEHMHGEQRFV